MKANELMKALMIEEDRLNRQRDRYQGYVDCTFSMMEQLFPEFFRDLSMQDYPESPIFRKLLTRWQRWSDRGQDCWREVTRLEDEFRAQVGWK